MYLVKILKDGSFIYLLLYIDYMLISSKSKVEIYDLNILIKSKFEIKDFERQKKILVMEIKRD